MATDFLTEAFPSGAEELRLALRREREGESIARAYLFRSIGEQAAAIRAARGLSQMTLAKASGTSQNKISNIESSSAGESNWSIRTLLPVARALGVRLKLSYETFGSLVAIREGTAPMAVPPIPEQDPLLLNPRESPVGEQLRRELLESAEYRQEYSETALYEDLALQIRALRRQRGLTQDDLGKKIEGGSQPKLSTFENPLETDKPPNWELETLLRVGFALRVRLSVQFASYGTLVEDAESMSSDSLRRAEPSHDSALIAEVTPLPDVDAPERTRWMQEMIIPWLCQESSLGIDKLVGWLAGRGLPPVGHDEEPYQWVLRGLPKANRGYFELKLAERLSVILGEQPDVEPIVTGQDDEFLAGLYWTCAGVSWPSLLFEPLWAAYKRLEQTKLSGPVRDALQAALVNNQAGDKPYRWIWLPMLQKGTHHLLRGNEITGYDGLRRRHEQVIPCHEELFQALGDISHRWKGESADVRAFRRLILRMPQIREYSVAKKLLAFAKSRSAGWSAWAKATLPGVREVYSTSGDLEISISFGQVLYRATWVKGGGALAVMFGPGSTEPLRTENFPLRGAPKWRRLVNVLATFMSDSESPETRLVHQELMSLIKRNSQKAKIPAAVRLNLEVTMLAQTALREAA